MKPPRFEYRAPDTLDEAVALLAADPAAKPIAGGQSLIPVLAFRLATPSLLVDLRRLPGLGNIIVEVDGVRLGAKVRWRDIEDDPRLSLAHPLLRAAVAHVAHYQIRNRGTIGGSLAHAGPPPSGASRPTTYSEPGSTEDGNVEITGRDLREGSDAVAPSIGRPSGLLPTS
jgi:carbon-monoxide dehydrogenase medium subunit